MIIQRQFYEELEQVFVIFLSIIRKFYFSVKVAKENFFSDRHVGIRVYIRIVMIMV